MRLLRFRPSSSYFVVSDGESPNVTDVPKFANVADVPFRKSERMNVRMSPKDLKDLKVRALQEGMPYQTLVSSVIRKYLSGRLVEKEQ